jgi:two-component system, OmpR family, phosphate regulon sensor histidine kinase PhoR
MSKKPSTLLLFYILAGYVILQFAWWAWLLVRLHEKKYMIIGEAAVFMVLLIALFILVRNSLRKETRINELQKNFMLSITHELRSPLASLRLQMETLLKRDLPKEKQEEILRNGLADTDRLNQLIENILIATQLENDVFSLHPQVANISTAASAISKRTALLAGRENDLILKLEDNVNAAFDELAFSSILGNILENAFKYSPATSPVLVKLWKQEGKAVISVSDQGPGISEEHRERIFEKFFRAGSEETRRTKGTGLGLFIAKNLARKQHWSLKHVNNSPKGSIFELIIPL